MNREEINEVSAILDRADEIERQERENPKPKITYFEFLARREGISVDELKIRMGLS